MFNIEKPLIPQYIFKKQTKSIKMENHAIAKQGKNSKILITNNYIRLHFTYKEWINTPVFSIKPLAMCYQSYVPLATDTELCCLSNLVHSKISRYNRTSKSFCRFPVKVRSTYKIACSCYHCHNSTAPSYVTEMLQKKPSHTCNTRSSSYAMPLFNRH